MADRRKEMDNEQEKRFGKRRNSGRSEDGNMQIPRRQQGPAERIPEYQQTQMQQKTAPIQSGSRQTTGAENTDESESVRIVQNPVIGTAQVRKARETLKKYKDGKARLEQRIVNNEQWYKMRHWKELQPVGKTDDPKPASGWLFNCIMSKHADFMDSYPEPNILPREAGDKEEAQELSSIIPVILEQNKFEQTYSDACWYKLKTGTGCFGVFWDKTKLNGLGDINIQQIDLLNLFWEPGIKDLQKSRNLFYLNIVDIDILEERYPELKGKVKPDTSDIKKYVYDDTVSTENKCIVVDWYYHKMINKKFTLQYCKFCGDEVLYATENEPGAERGWYDHGKYPFVFDVLFREEGLPTGFGYVDVCKEAQESIDRMNNDIEVSARWAARPRWFIRNDGGVNEEEYADLSSPFVHVDGNMSEDSMKEIVTNPVSDVYVTVLNNKIEELKETSGNRDVNNGGATSGVTAASAIAAMQEQSGKSSRDMIKASYRAYAQVIEMVIELIRQFYDMPRKFRIIGENGQEQFTTYSNDRLKLQYQGKAFGVDMGYRLPVFDIKVSAQKENPYSKVSQNELALRFYNAGFFNPEMADQALACIEMMDFTGKDAIVQKITSNGTIYQQMLEMQQQILMLSQIIDQTQGTGLAAAKAGEMTGQKTPAGKDVNIRESGSLGELKQEESGVVSNARERANQATSPR